MPYRLSQGWVLTRPPCMEKLQKWSSVDPLIYQTTGGLKGEAAHGHFCSIVTCHLPYQVHVSILLSHQQNTELTKKDISSCCSPLWWNNLKNRSWRITSHIWPPESKVIQAWMSLTFIRWHPDWRGKDWIILFIPPWEVSLGVPPSCIYSPPQAREHFQSLVCSVSVALVCHGGHPNSERVWT